MDSEMADTIQTEGIKVPSNDGDAECGIFENG